MKIKTLKKSHLKRNIIIGVVVVAIISAVILNFTRAKYRVTQSIPLVNGTINYTLPDLNIVGLYIDGEEATELDSSKKYILDTTQSICTYKDGTEIENLNISYDSETSGLSISPYTTKGTKCTLYFNEQVFVKDTILANYPIVKTRTFPLTASSKVEGNTTGVIYKSADSNQYDNDGEVYYFAGNPTDNWVSWAGFYWRIIRINGNGSIRMIYQGTSDNTTGTGTQLQTSAFNSSYDRSEYVGLKYTTGSQHGTGSNSTIMGVLNTFYQEKLASYADDIDTNAGFCSDRNMASGYSWSSQPSSTIYYAAYGRLVQSSSNVNPSFKCSNSSDLYTTSGSSQGNKALQYPIGLITADEVSFAGGVYGTNNQSYYLYTGQAYWTMSPRYFSSSYASVFLVDSIGGLNGTRVDTAFGVRPAINLRADILLSGSGTSNDPYTVN